MTFINHQNKVEEALSFLQEKIDTNPRCIIILGTALGGLTQHIEDPIRIPYHHIPNFPEATAPTHDNNLIFGRLQGVDVAVLQGRFHFYEGYSAQELTLPLRVLSLMQSEICIVSNAAGGLNPSFSPGTLMVLSDHLNFIPDNPLRGPNIDDWGPRFPDLSEPYDRELIETTLKCAARLNISKVTTGVYTAIPGPSLETPAETRFLRSCGADAVGMSTVPEVIVAKHAGLRVLGISVVANINDPDNFKPIILEDVIEQTAKVEKKFQQLVLEVIKEL